METDRVHDSIQRLLGTGSRRALMAKSLLGAAAGLLPAALLADPAAAFRSLAGCQKKCNHKFSGKCRSRCRSCCQKVFEGGKNSCNFGCGAIRLK